jgi:hypothetical protein
MKKSLILIISLILSVSWVHAFEKDGLHYTIIDGEAVVINANQEDKVTAIEYVYNHESEKISYSENGYEGDIVIPASVEYGGQTYPVTGIAHWAFARTEKITSVSIPEGIKHIGCACFFYNWGVASLDFPNSVEKIGSYACAEMKSLARARLPERLDTIPIYMFYSLEVDGRFGAPLKEVVMPKSCKVIGGSSFQCQRNLETCVLPEDVEVIDIAAFGSDRKLKMTLPSSVKYIGGQALHMTLSPVNQPNWDNLQLQPYSFFAAKGLKQISISEHITTIPDDCFGACNNVETLEFNASLDTIGARSFYPLHNLKAVILPSSIKYLGRYAFEDCEKLHAVYARMKMPCNLVNNEFKSIPSDAILYVPVGCKENYERAGWGKYFVQIIEMEEAEQKQEFDKIATGISTVKADDGVKPSGWYDLQGRRLTEPRKGVNIIRYNDGTARKVLK